MHGIYILNIVNILMAVLQSAVAHCYYVYLFIYLFVAGDFPFLLWSVDVLYHCTLIVK